MKRKYRLKRSAKNPFTKLTGVQAIQLTGSRDCLVVGQKSMLPSIPLSGFKKQHPVKIVAAFAYLTHNVAVSNKPAEDRYIRIGDIEKVKQTCGVLECVNPLHLEVTLQADKRPY